ncbi:MAG: DNA polymerase-3 subunit beta [Chloroflexi bacterium]|jgi:DNA polymerase-3 subunit beta|nr:MAG: DNA polymerase-3 subunit beta [Chloroflexota bacterium]
MATDGSQLTLAATNLEIAITTWVGASVEQQGNITVPARLLTEFISSLPADTVHLTSTDQPKALDLSCARSQAHINGTEAEDFPPIPNVEGGVSITLSSSALRTAVQQVHFAAATEDSRPVLTGIKVEITGREFTLAAADGFRLAVHTSTLDNEVSEPVDIIVPARTLNEVVRLLGEQEESIEMVVNSAKSQVLFRLKGAELVSQLVQGTFPNYSQLIPQGYATRAVVPIQEIQRAARTASIFARDGSGIIRLQMTPSDDGKGKLVVSARAEEVGEHEGETDAVVEGEEGKIAFNARYLIDVLAVIDKAEVAVEITTPSSPGVFKPVGSDSYVHVVMPMFVQW